MREFILIFSLLKYFINVIYIIVYLKILIYSLSFVSSYVLLFISVYFIKTILFCYLLMRVLLVCD